MGLHCWHESGVSKLTNPAQYEDVCCHCGKKRWRVETPKGHGSFFPRKRVLEGNVEDSRPFQNEECNVV
jgi:hypothetical protein